MSREKFGRAIGVRIKEFRLSKGFKMKPFCSIVGISQGTLSDIENELVNPSADTLLLIIRNTDINPTWLLTGEESMKREGKSSSMVSEGRVTYNKVSDDKEVTAKVSATAGEIIEGDFIFIPQVSGEISAGGGLLPDNTIEMKIAFKKDWIERKGDPRNMSLIRVSGDSMEPTLLSGDLVLVDHNRNCIDPQGGIYALSIDNTIMLKRLQMMYHTQKLRIISDNAKYETIETSSEQVRINGKVIWFAREIER